MILSDQEVAMANLLKIMLENDLKDISTLEYPRPQYDYMFSFNKQAKNWWQPKEFCIRVYAANIWTLLELA